jgi:hemerythrin HHE cation binding domain-containing protein
MQADVMKKADSHCLCDDPNCLKKHFVACMASLEALCTELEGIADSLPDRFDSQLGLATAQRLLGTIKKAHDFEESTLYPALTEKAGALPEFLAIIERLKYEHWGDEDFAGEVFHQIREFAANGTPETAERLSWTLRGLFENMRRHIEFEREFLLPLSRACQ